MIEIILSPLVFILSLIVPKTKRLICFGAWYGKKYGDNSQALFESFASESNYHAIWITKDKKIYQDLKSRNLPVYYFMSLKGILCQLRAKTFITSVNSRDFLFGVISPRNLVFSLWHGSPLKKIGFDVHVSVLKKVTRVIRFYTTDHISFVISPAPIFDPIFISAFNITEKQIIRCGYPRCDVLFSDKNGKTRSHYKVAYLPTHRNEGFSADTLEKVYNELITHQQTLRNEKVEIIFKPHFYDIPFFNKTKNIDTVKIDINSDTYSLLSDVDMLITDYSSVFFDFDITGKPILFFAPDLEVYKEKSRDLYFDYTEIIGDYITNVEELINKVIYIKKNRVNSSNAGFSNFNETKSANNSFKLKCLISKMLDDI